MPQPSRRRALRSLIHAAWLAALVAAPVLAQQDSASANAAKPTAEQMAATMAAQRADIVGNVAFVSGHILELAKAVPADKFGWRPAPGVRSYAEVQLHMAGANYFLPKMLGVELPSDVPDLQKIETAATDKAQVIAILEKSLAFAKSAFETFPAEKLDNQVDFFGQKMSSRAVLLALQGHLHEHLGQSIAYARMNGVAPPWSQ